MSAGLRPKDAIKRMMELPVSRRTLVLRPGTLGSGALPTICKNNHRIQLEVRPKPN